MKKISNTTKRRIAKFTTTIVTHVTVRAVMSKIAEKLIDTSNCNSTELVVIGIGAEIIMHKLLFDLRQHIWNEAVEPFVNIFAPEDEEVKDWMEEVL